MGLFAEISLSRKTELAKSWLIFSAYPCVHLLVKSATVTSRFLEVCVSGQKMCGQASTGPCSPAAERFGI